MTDQSGFLPEDYIEKRMERRTNVLAVALFVIVMAGVIGAFYVTDRQRADVRQLQQRVNQRFEEAAKRLEQLERLEAQKQQMVRKAQVTASLIEPVPRTLMLAELVNIMPASLGLLDLEMNSKVIKAPRPRFTSSLEAARQQKQGEEQAKAEPEEPAVPPTEVSLRLTGVAPTDVDVAQFMTGLAQRPLFTDVNLVFSEEVTMDGRTLRKFRVDLKLARDLDIEALEPLMVKRELKQDPMSEQIQINPNGKMSVPDAPVVPTKAPPSTTD
jgi:Tfp pilus assembly protein PilN